jgi:hypothetical protein
VKWLAALDIDEDPITACRLMNIFRRKGMKIITLALAARPRGYSLIALLDTPENQVEHLFNFLRRTEGVEHVTCYRHEPNQHASLVFIDAESPSVARFLDAFPGSRLVFAGEGKCLLEVPAPGDLGGMKSGFDQLEFMPFACVKTTRAPSDEGVEA